MAHSELDLPAADPPQPDDDPAFAADATVQISDVSVWFGPKVALSELSCSFGPGVTGLLGPNGAGKTTLMRAMTGLIGVNQGTVRVEGRDPHREREIHGRMALVPEDEAVPGGLTARQLLDAVRRICLELPVVGIDVVEVSPPYDHAEITAYLANRVCLEALSGIAARKKGITHDPAGPLLEGRNT